DGPLVGVWDAVGRGGASHPAPATDLRDREGDDSAPGRPDRLARSRADEGQARNDLDRLLGTPAHLRNAGLQDEPAALGSRGRRRGGPEAARVRAAAADLA